MLSKERLPKGLDAVAVDPGVDDDPGAITLAAGGSADGWRAEIDGEPVARIFELDHIAAVAQKLGHNAVNAELLALGVRDGLDNRSVSKEEILFLLKKSASSIKWKFCLTLGLVAENDKIYEAALAISSDYASHIDARLARERLSIYCVRPP